MRADCRVLLISDSDAAIGDLRQALGGELHITDSLSGNEPEIFSLELDEVVVVAGHALEIDEPYDLAIIALATTPPVEFLSTQDALRQRVTTMLLIVDEGPEPIHVWKQRSRYDRVLCRPFTDGVFLERVEQLLLQAMRKVPAVIPDEAYLAFLGDLLEREHRVVRPIVSPEHGAGFYYPSVASAFGFTVNDHSLLERLTELGLCRRRVALRMRRCAACASHQLAFGDVCAACESADYAYEPALRHVTCGHLDTVARAKRGDRLVCPKCDEAMLTTGRDYEPLAGYHRCRTCGAVADKTATLVRCLDCGHASAPERTRELVLHEYELTAQAEEAVAAGTIGGFSLAVALRNFHASLHSRSYFLNELKREATRHRSYGIPASLVLVRLEGLDQANRSDERTFAAAAEGAWRAVMAILRKLDTACVWSEDVLAVLLPGTPADGARLVLQRLEAQLAALKPGLPGSMVAAVTVTDEGPDAMLRHALGLVGIGIDSPDEDFFGADEGIVVIEDGGDVVLDLNQYAK
ncbi:MAG: hypothetical protein H0W83_17785 [Planctomycetes bacterium]|nr:hypothetical protein [Planctomycetota bacterium]